MSESNSFESPEKEPAQSAQEILKLEIDNVLDEYFLLVSRRGLDADKDQLDEKIISKRQELIELTQKLNGQSEIDDAFVEQMNEQLEHADKGVEIGKEELEARDDGKDNVEAIIADMKEYDIQLGKFYKAIDAIKSTLENKAVAEREELEVLVAELKTMIRAFMNIGREIQNLISSLESDDKAELVEKQITIMNDVVGAIKNFDETSKDKNKLDKIKKHFYIHFDEALHFYEELRDLAK